MKDARGMETFKEVCLHVPVADKSIGVCEGCSNMTIDFDTEVKLYFVAVRSNVTMSYTDAILLYRFLGFRT